MLSSTNSKWVRFISDLVRRTRQRELTWDYISPTSEQFSQRNTAPIVAMFETVVEGQPVRLVEYKFKGTDDEGETWHWSPSLRLEILDGGRSIAFPVPEREGLRDLHEVIAQRLTNADGLLAKLGYE